MGEPLTERQAPWTSEESPEGARPAATLILLRDQPDPEAAAQVLMLQRASTMGFAAGATVFPGGAVDEGDYHLAGSLDHRLSLPDAASRIAAIRETIEEAGVAVGLSGSVSPEDVAEMRASLHGGIKLGTLLEALGLTLDLDILVPFARWCPQVWEARIVRRRFDTRFYLARAPDDGHVATADTTENVRLMWAAPAEILDAVADGREKVIFPTLRNIERLALARRFDDMATFARSLPVALVAPWVEDRDGAPHLCIPEDLGYPVTSQPLASVLRG